MKIGLIGLNSFKNEDHFLSIKNALDKNLFAIFSPHSEEILPLSKIHGIKLFTSANELYTNADAIYFANSLKPNYDFALNALKKSCHLFIEDISTLTIDDIKYLYKIAFEARTKIQLKLTKSFSPEYLEIKNHLNEPKLIEINSSFTHLLRNEDYFKEILNNLHIAYQYVNSGIKKISTLALPIDKNHFSLVNTRIDFDNGSIVNLKSENIVSKIKNTATFYQSGQVMRVDFHNHLAEEQKLDKGHVIRNEFKIQKNNALKNEMVDFINSCKNFNPENISESPKIYNVIKATHTILENLSHQINAG